MALGTGIEIPNNFDLNSPLPLDARYKCASIAERDAIPEVARYHLMQVAVDDDGEGNPKLYWLKGGITNSDWEEFSSGGGGGILTVADKTEREAIESDERYDGLFVFQKDSLTLWQLQGGITDDKWVIQDLGLRRKSGTELQEFSSAGEVALLPVMTQRVLLAGDGGSYAVTLPTPDFEGQRVLVIGMSNEFPVKLAGIDFTENRNRWFQSVGGAWIMEGL